MVTFMSVIFVNDVIVSAGDDGSLYVWNERRVVKKQSAHPKAAILCLTTTSNSNMFVSGGQDSKIIIWEMASSENNYILEKFYEYKVDNGHIQSLCIGS